MQFPTRLGRYELVALLGEGGMGRVYEAVLHGPAGFRKKVALKVLKEGGRGLLREARLGGLLRHPNLVEVYALEQVDGRWVCAMELVRGGSLRNHTPLPQRAVVEVGLQVCAGLRRAHVDIGLVHLDLKPANLLLRGSTVKIADFGFARADGFPAERRISGTPAYMSPEQRAGQAVDARSDIWSLGVVLVELATGQPSRDPMAVPWLAPILERCLAPDPNARYRNIGEVGSALSALEVAGEGLADVVGRPRDARSSGSWSTPIPTSQNTYTFLVGAAPKTNLAPPADRTFGRRELLADLVARLERPGMVTLKGTGGLGKTRSARIAARTWHDGGHGQAWFVDLAEARTRQDLLTAAAGVLGVPLSGPAGDLEDRVGHAMGGRGPMVVVLDNFEQVVAHASLVDRWRELAPDVRWLVTSREPLGLGGEQVVDLEPLDDADGVALLLHRAEELGADLDREDPALPALVRRLDGLPLALELAASRLRLMPPSQVLERLDDRFRLLRSGRRDLSARQATLRATLEWSWEFMSEAERAGFAQCAVFASSFTVVAAEAVLDLPDDQWALDVLDALVRKSVLTQRDGRLRLFETTRAFAAEKLDDPEARRRHAAWYARLGAESESERRRGKHDVELVHALNAERGNLRLAVDHALELGEADLAGLTCLALSEIFELHGPIEAWRTQTLRVLEHGGFSPTIHGRLERAAGVALAESYRFDDAREHMERSLQIHRAAGDVRSEGIALNNLAVVSSDLGELDLAIAQVTDALRLLREVGDRRFEGVATGNLASFLNELGRVDEALAHQQESERIHAEVRDRRARARALGNLGNIYGGRGQLDKAVDCYERALVLYRKLGALRLEAITLGNLTTVLVMLGEHERAAARVRTSIQLSREAGDRRNLGVGLATLSTVLVELGEHHEAWSAAEQAVELLDEVGDRVWAGIATGYLGRQKLRTREPGAAVPYLERAVAEVEGRHALAHAGLLASLGEALALSGQEERGVSELRRAIGLMEAGGYTDELALAREALDRVDDAVR